jgi:nucleotide-binding universal stress UspA family protein
MARVNSILLAAEREDAVHQSVSRALMLARYLSARLDILLCDPDSLPPASDGAASQRSAAEARDFLDALRNSILAPDVEITTEAAFDGSLHEHVARKVRREGSSLVVKGIGRVPLARENHLNWQLIRTSPAPLLLTRGHPWHPRARFAAVIDGHAPRHSSFTADVGTSLQLACGAELDLIYLQGDADGAGGKAQSIAGDLHVSLDRLHILGRDGAEILPQFIDQRGFDLVALPTADGLAAGDAAGFGVERALADKLTKSTVLDLLFVKQTDQKREIAADKTPSTPLPRPWPKALRLVCPDGDETASAGATLRSLS